MQKNVHQNRRKIYFTGFPPHKPSVRGGLCPHATFHHGHHSKASDVFGLSPPSQLVIKYQWLVFLNQILEQYKIDHI